MVGRVDGNADETVHRPAEGAIEPIGQDGLNHRAFEEGVSRFTRDGRRGRDARHGCGLRRNTRCASDRCRREVRESRGQRRSDQRRGVEGTSAGSITGGSPSAERLARRVPSLAKRPRYPPRGRGPRACSRVERRARPSALMFRRAKDGPPRRRRSRPRRPWSAAIAPAPRPVAALAPGCGADSPQSVADWDPRPRRRARAWRSARGFAGGPDTARMATMTRATPMSTHCWRCRGTTPEWQPTPIGDASRRRWTCQARVRAVRSSCAPYFPSTRRNGDPRGADHQIPVIEDLRDDIGAVAAPRSSRGWACRP